MSLVSTPSGSVAISARPVLETTAVTSLRELLEDRLDPAVVLQRLFEADAGKPLSLDGDRAFIQLGDELAPKAERSPHAQDEDRDGDRHRETRMLHGGP